MRRVRRVVVSVCAVGALVVSGGVALRARQGVQPASLPDGSLSALTAEVRALRLSIEESAKTQTQVQGLGVYLSVEKDRLLQTAARLDSARKDTLEASFQTAKALREQATYERELNDPGLPASQRALATESVQNLKQLVERVRSNEADARNRESMAEQAYQIEDARWNDLVSRLEQVIRK